ncbi:MULTISPECIES: hypothetical protein [unclassified Duganella]|uniref:hypothetical protein n=1 Tax=unclassified Duganella TaxID=2636909 RepID=UPI000882FF07|nr:MULTISPECIES: hypothetical protein [unclassified Duganella]SDG40119.1 hypothetical protein SAMN05216320_104197 [Duganella sp. OV458]SDJ63752.1 hypothetical protein SAMN05428973_105207 [Duganella sp. OV510]
MKTLKVKCALALALILGCVQLAAAPAPWWKWRSKIDGTLICSQTPLGPGWDKAYGPFRDARCEKLIVVR